MAFLFSLFKNMKQHKKIGFFDSGSGGLSILQNYIGSNFDELYYVADTAYLPYGQKSHDVLLQRGITVTKLLLQKNIDTIVVACHTSSATILPELKKLFPEVTYLDMLQPTITAALKTTQNNRIGVFATQATIKTGIHKQLLQNYNPEITVIEQACPLLVPLIETLPNSELDLVTALQNYLEAIIIQQADTLILGCTHYAFTKQYLQKLAPHLLLISAQDTVIISKTKIPQTITFFVSGNIQEFENNIKLFLKLKNYIISSF